MLTCVEVSVSEGLEHAVHGAHVEQEAQLSDGHRHQTEQEDGTNDGFQEWLSCKENQAKTISN